MKILSTANKSLIAAVLAVLGVAGNFFALPIAFSVEFVFGSIASIVAIVLLGPWWGVGVAFAASSYTVVLWNHPYALVIFTLEALWIGVAFKRGRTNVLLSDALFWLSAGWLLVLAFYSGIMGLDAQSTLLIILKQALNGILNALLASILLSHTAIARLAPKDYAEPAYNKLIFHAMCAFLMLPTLTLLTYQNYQSTSELKQQTAMRVLAAAQIVRTRLAEWLARHRNAVVQIAELGSRYGLVPTEEVQEELARINALFPDFHNVYLGDARGTTVAFHPPRNELGESTIGLNFADRAYFKQLLSTRQPLISDGFAGRGGVFKPIFIIAAPEIKQGRLSHYGLAAVNLDRVREKIAPFAQLPDMVITVLDGNGKVIVSTDPSRKQLEALPVMNAGQTVEVMKDVSLTIPGAVANTGVMGDWKGAYYLSSLSVADTRWKLRVEYPVAPLLAMLYESSIKGLGIVALLFVPMFGFAFVTSRYLTTPLLALANITVDIPAKIENDEEIVWPNSNIAEVAMLANNFRQASLALGEKIGRLNHRLSLAADSAQIGVWEYFVAENRLVWDRWMYALYGVHEEDFSGAYEAWTQGLHPEDRVRGDQEIDLALRGEKEFDTEFRVLWPNGEVRHLKAAAHVLRDAEGKPLRMIGVNYDITERKRKEEELRQAEFLLRSAIDTIGEAFVVYDPQDRLAFCNEEYRELYRTSAPVIQPGRSFEEIIRYGVAHGQYKEAIGREEPWIAERLATHRSGNQQLIQQLGDGRWLKVTERRTPDGHTVGFRIDVTEFLRAKEAAEAANIAKSRFLATMSHEIRTPMNGILGMAQMLLMPGLKDSERQDYARIILTSGQTLLALLNNILDVSKVESGKLELEVTVLDPGQIIRETQVLFAELAGQKGLRVVANWSGPAGQRYLGDPHRLRQMLSNLLNNAIKFTAQGEIHMDAREVERDGQHALLEFAVSDSGIGIPEDQQRLLFRPFAQADSSTTRQFGGTGLGLSIVRSLAMLMGGDVGVDSEVGRGSHFWFRIRADLVASGVDSRKADVNRGEGSPGELAGNILVVEDNPTNRMVIKAMLGKPGLHCDFVEDGRQAVDAITGGMAPDLVLMDCQMPVMDGFEATRRIRRWEAENSRPRMIIVALTAGAFDEDRNRCVEAGMDDFLVKPIDVRTLTATLGRWLSAGDVAMPATAPSTTSTDGTTVPLFDEARLLSQLGGDRELAKIVVESASRDISDRFEQLALAVAAGNSKDAERHVHTLKGLTAQIGGMRLFEHLTEINARFKSGSATDSAAVADLRREYQQLSDILAQWTAAQARSPQTPVVAVGIVAIYRELEAMLAQNKFAAVGRIRDLRDALAGTEASADIDEIAGLIQEFNFERARERLRRVAAAQGWEGKSS